jgi:hypothetical protein
METTAEACTHEGTVTSGTHEQPVRELGVNSLAFFEPVDHVCYKL